MTNTRLTPLNEETALSDQLDLLPFTAQTAIKSEHASKYLTVLCRHFSRKVDAKWDGVTGTVYFPVGITTMRVDENKSILSISCHSKSAQQLEYQKIIISQHIDTYSRREAIEIVWSVG